jgi:hypothetical protein
MDVARMLYVSAIKTSFITRRLTKRYSEGAGERALANGPLGTTGGSTKLTVALCTFACNAAGYIFAGVEYAQECCEFSCIICKASSTNVDPRRLRQYPG